MNLFEQIEYIFSQIDADYLLVNNANEWFDETPNILESSVYTLTGFTGDTGDALLCKDGKCYLFVDGRYHIQADNEVKNGVIVIKLQSGQKQDEEICKIICYNSKLAIIAQKISYGRYENIKKLLNEKNIEFLPLNKDIINNTNLEKSKDFQKNGCKPRVFKNNKSMLITDPIKVSYLTQNRNFEVEGSSKIYAKLFIDENGNEKLFTNKEEMEKFLKNYNNEISVEKCISLYDYGLINKPIVEDNGIDKIKSVKTDEEIEVLQKAFRISDKALLETREFILNSKSGELSEYDISEKLKDRFFKHGATGLSFRPIVAINQHSALAHYNHFSKDTYLNDGDLVLIDCGIYTNEGLATDTTRVLIKGSPNNLQKQVYTLVLKAFLNCYALKNKTGFEMNELAHEILDNKIKDGSTNNDFFVFNHGLGHGIGIAVHECPPSLSKSEIAKQRITDSMCYTIEPGLYNKNYFGIRLENSFYRKNGENISFNSIGFEKKMILFEDLTTDELEILKSFELLD